MYKSIEIQSNSRVYKVSFMLNCLSEITSNIHPNFFFLVDANVACKYKKTLNKILENPSTCVIEATEENKSIERIIPVIKHLVDRNIRRSNVLVAIGGGVIQDITCFIASTLLRGVEWQFIPTTLLAQADSCIGSKSSINLGSIKNILGTFNPPSQISIYPEFLNTLDKSEVQSGIGEILKVHAIEGCEAFDKLSLEFDQLMLDESLIVDYIQSSLLIKKKYIEMDEFDKGIRNIFNYGHSFGHAIESATRFCIPHGVAVSMGMNMANHISVMRGLMAAEHRDRMSNVLLRNYHDFKSIEIPFDDMWNALMKDKKNTTSELMLIFPVGDRAEIKKVAVQPDDLFKSQCRNFIEAINL